MPLGAIRANVDVSDKDKLVREELGYVAVALKSLAETGVAVFNKETAGEFYGDVWLSTQLALEGTSVEYVPSVPYEEDDERFGSEYRIELKTGGDA